MPQVDRRGDNVQMTDRSSSHPNDFLEIIMMRYDLDSNTLSFETPAEFESQSKLL